MNNRLKNKYSQYGMKHIQIYTYLEIYISYEMNII